MFSAYHKLLQKYPLPTRMITCGLIWSLADAVNQKFVYKHQNFDFKRNISLFLVGVLYTAPVLNLWHMKMVPLIEKTLFTQKTAKISRVLTMVCIDQCFLAPTMLTGFFIMNGIVNSQSLSGIKKGVEDWKQKFWQALETNWKVWPLATAFNFWFIPIAYRVLFSNSVSFFWNILLSSIAYDKKIGKASSL